MITVKVSQKIFTYAEVMNLRGFALNIYRILQSDTIWASICGAPTPLEPKPTDGSPTVRT